MSENKKGTCFVVRGGSARKQNLKRAIPLNLDKRKLINQSVYEIQHGVIRIQSQSHKPNSVSNINSRVMGSFLTGH